MEAVHSEQAFASLLSPAWTMWRKPWSIHVSSCLGWQCWQEWRRNAVSILLQQAYSISCVILIIFLLFFLICGWCVSRKHSEGRLALCKHFSQRTNSGKEKKNSSRWENHLKITVIWLETTLEEKSWMEDRGANWPCETRTGGTEEVRGLVSILSINIQVLILLVR